MSKLFVVCLTLVWAPGGAVVAEEWRTLPGAEIETVLSARVLGYEDGTTQNFFSDGRTLFAAGSGESWGSWRVEGDQYCSSWPPSQSWACYQVEIEAGGLDVKFTGESGAPSVGRFQDLN